MTELELDQAFLVDMDSLERLRNDVGIKTSTKMIAKRLRDRGWLLPTEQIGVWEFAPGAHAGPIGRGHPFREIQAALRADPALDAAVCLTSAMWAHGLLDKAPARPEVALPKGDTVPAGLKRAARIVHFDRHLPTVRVRGTPTHRPATILVHLAAHPSNVRSWSAILDALPELLRRVEAEDLQEESTGRPAAVATRLAYLIHGIDPALASRLAPADHGKVWFGPRGPLKRHNQTFNVADTILPISPSQLEPSQLEQGPLSP
ncbi:MAG: type IV toxin-antitoxin system AbiEi family antitoxin [Thioalkalivibrio sp.]|nr:type IV toxin-antitoxin system AbiEi family antitoxin [Thioalkalivibrio sp.]